MTDATRQEAIQWCIENDCDFATGVLPPVSGWAWVYIDGAEYASPGDLKAAVATPRLFLSPVSIQSPESDITLDDIQKAKVEALRGDEPADESGEDVDLTASREEVIEWCRRSQATFLADNLPQPTPHGWSWVSVNPDMIYLRGPSMGHEITVSDVYKSAPTATIESNEQASVKPSYSAIIFNGQAELEGMGWTVETGAYDLPEFTCWADYDNKHLAIHNPKAYYTSQVIERVLTGAHSGAKGHYVYANVDGEVMVSKEGEEWNHLQLTVRPHNPETDVRQPKQEPTEVIDDEPRPDEDSVAE